jgi:hypothetical protein
MLERTNFMNGKSTTARRRRQAAFVVARASACTWAVAFARQLIPGALFRTKGAALAYASSLARAAGLRSPKVTVLGEA